MANPNFSSILDEAPTEVKAPPPMPAGTYTFIVQGQPRYDKSSKKGTDFVEFTLKPIAAESDVDEDELEELGGLEGKTIRATYYLTEDAAFLLDQFHEHCGVDLSEPASRKARNDEVVNAEVRGYIKHESSQDGSRTFARLARTLPAG